MIRNQGALGLFLALLAAASIQFVSKAYSQEFPNQAIHIIVPTQAGGVSDMLSRMYAQKLKERTNATVVVENKTGAGGILAATYVARSKPDGYTIYLGFQGTQSVLQHIDPKLPYDPVKDFAPVVLLASGPSVLTVHPSFPAKTVAEFVDVLKKNPGKYSYASAGVGTTHHLAAELFKLHTGVTLEGVTYRGAAPAVQDVIAGHVPIVFENLGNALNTIRDGRLRVLAIASKERSPLLPEVPTMGEVGYPDVISTAWFGLFVPANTPTPIIAWLNKQANEIFRAPEIQEVLLKQGLTVRVGAPETFGEFVKEETKRWGEVVRKANIKLQ